MLQRSRGSSTANEMSASGRRAHGASRACLMQLSKSPSVARQARRPCMHK
jgi:hypothetical protein